MKLKLFSRLASATLGAFILLNSIPISSSAFSNNPFEKEDSLREKIMLSASGKKNSFVSINKKYMGDIERYIAVFKEDVSLKEIHKRLSGYNYRLLADSDERIFLVYTYSHDEFFQKNKDVLDSFEKDTIKENLSYYPNDTYSDAYELELLQMNEAWSYSLGNEKITVAIVDSGIDRTHEDFSGTKILSGFDYESGQSIVNVDSSGHGTKVAGIIAATGNNGVGCVGIAPKCTLLPLKITNSEGKIYTSDFIDSLYLATDSGANVINMSLGGYEKLESEEKAVKYAVDKGCILVAAAGNEGNHKEYAGQKCYPASYNGVISVGAVDEKGESCIFSQHNDAVDISAPGSALSLLNYGGGYTLDSGTSFSSAYISGVAALALSVLDEGYKINSDQFDFLISSYATGTSDNRNGAGLLCPPQVLKHANFPLVSGVENGGVYYDNVKISFNRGTAILDDEAFESGELCKHTGEHILKISDGDKETEVFFTTDNLPLTCSLKEGEGYSYISFPFGSATLNGHPYFSGDKITADGKHTLVLTGLYGNTKSFDFFLSFSSPQINGVKHGEIYTNPVRISVATGGKIYLNGKEKENEFTVFEEGQHTLLIKQNGNLKTTVNFTISYENENNPYKFITAETSLSNAKTVSESGIIVVWNDINRGIRLYERDTTRLIRYVNVGESVKDIFFGEKYLYISGTNHIFGIKKEELKTNATLSSLYEFTFPVSAADFHENALYCVESSAINSGTVKKIPLDSFYEEEICFIRSIPDVLSYDEITDSLAFRKKGEERVFVSPVSGGSISTFSPFESNEEGIIFKNGKIACGGEVFSVKENRLVFTAKDSSALYFDGKTLITEKASYNVETGEILGYHGLRFSSVSYDGKTYSCAFGDVSLYISDSLPTASPTELSYSTGAPFGFTENYYFSKSFTHTVCCGGDIVASCDENALYVLDSTTLKPKSRIYLPFVPTGMSCAGKEVYVYSEKINVLGVYRTDTQKLTLYNTPCGISQMTACTSYAAFIGKGDLYIWDIKKSSFALEAEGDYISIAFSHDGKNLYTTHSRSFYTVLTSYLIPEFEAEYERVLDYEAEEIFCDNAYLYINTAAYSTRNGGIAASCSSKIYGKSSSAFITAKGLFENGEYISSFDGASDAFVLKDNGELLLINGKRAVKFKNTYGDDFTRPPVISGFQNGKTYNESVTVAFSKGIAYLDGNQIKSGHVVSDGGEHSLLLLLPFGMKYSYSFRINASLTSLRIKGGDTAIKVNDTKEFEVEFLPSGSPAEEVVFYTDDDIISVTPDGVVTGLEAGEAYLCASTIDGRIYTKIKISVLSSMLVFTSSYLGTDRNNGILYGVSSGTTVDALINSLDPTLKENAVIYHEGKEAAGIVKTGMEIRLLNKKGEVLDSLLISVTGDCNGDGNVDIGDLTTACQLMSMENAEAVYVKSADFSNTGTIDVADTFTYKEIILGNEKTVENANTQKEKFQGGMSIECITEADGTVTVTIFAEGIGINGVSGKLKYDEESFTFISAERIGYISGAEDFGEYVSFLASFRKEASDEKEKIKVAELTFLPIESRSGTFTAEELIVFTGETYVTESVTKKFSYSSEDDITALTPSAGMLIPQFTPDNYSYVLKLPENVTSVTFSHEGTEDINVIMEDKISDGSVIKILCGDKEYTVTVITQHVHENSGVPFWLIAVISVSFVLIAIIVFFGKSIKRRFFPEEQDIKG